MVGKRLPIQLPCTVSPHGGDHQSRLHRGFGQTTEQKITATQLPTASAVVARYFEARGGRTALESLRSVERIGEITFYLPEGESTGGYHTCVQYPDYALIEIEGGPVQFREALIRGTAYRYDKDAAVWRPAETERSTELADTARTANRELLFEEDRWRTGTVAIEGADVVVYGSHNASTQTIYRFSADTGLLASKSSGERERVYDDWRNIDGVWFPFSIDDYHSGRYTQRVRLNQVKRDIDLGQTWTGLAIR